MEVVIDFTGYYYENKFIIKEFCKCRIFEHTVTPSKSIVSQQPSYFYDDIYANYYKISGIKSEEGRHKIHQLKTYIKKTLKLYKIVYVKDEEKSMQLMEFMMEKYKNIIPLKKIGFTDKNLKRKKLACEYHDDRINNYCARINAEIMAEWVYGQRTNKATFSLRNKFLLALKNIENKNCHLIVNFNGFQNLSNKFIIKEWSAYVLSTEGREIDHQLLVSQPSNFHENLNMMIQKYFTNYYDHYGITWDTSNCTLHHMKIKIKSLFEDYKINYIFVKDLDAKSELLIRIQHDRDQIICLSELGYENIFHSDSIKQCTYHSNPNPEKNICADFENKKMLKWILEMQLYKKQVLDSIKNFKIVAQNKHENASTGNDDYSVNVELLPADKDKSNYLDFDIDEILNRPLNIRQNLSTIDILTDLLQSSDDSGDSFGNSQQLLDNDFEIDDEVLSQFDTNKILDRPSNIRQNLSKIEILNDLLQSSDDSGDSFGNSQQLLDDNFEIDDEVLSQFDIDSSWINNHNLDNFHTMNDTN